MLDIKVIRENSEKVKMGIAAKQLDFGLVDRVLESYDNWTKKLQIYEKLKHEKKEIDEQGKASGEGRIIKEKVKDAEIEVQKACTEYQEIEKQIPNLPADDVKIGKDETENEVLRKWGEVKAFDFPLKDHLELGGLLDIIDVERAAKISGTRFYFLKNNAVLLEFALIQLAFETLLKEGFAPIIPPVLIEKETMEALGYMEHGGEEDMYYLPKDDLFLVGTSEQSIVPMHKDEIFDERDLPKRYVGFSTCFRREAGSYGKDARGILRAHQFDKVEMVSYVKQGEGNREHDYLLSLEEKLLQLLGLPYQVVKMCTGDLGFPTARKYDIEAWIPSQGRYRELTSTSTTTDFQARRLNIKYREQDKKNYVNILNGTVFSTRPIIAILENYQQSDGSVLIPQVLQKYLGKEKITPKKT